MYNGVSDNGNSSTMAAVSKYIGGSTYNRERRAKSQYYGMFISMK